MNSSAYRSFSIRRAVAAFALTGTLSLAAIACGPVLATPEIAQASRAVEDAESAEADRFAVYEYTLAVEYLDKAREEWGQGRYQKALEYGELARQFADEATRRAQRSPQRGASDLDRRLP